MTDETSIPEAVWDRTRIIEGAKAVVFMPEGLPVLLRDNIPTIPYPDMWDFPGGGREAGESAVDCVIREAREELNLVLKPEDFTYARCYIQDGGQEMWFFAAFPEGSQREDMVLGDEGQSWRFMSVEEFLTDPKAIPRLQKRVANYIAGV